MRCTRCGREAAEADKYCAECGMFLRDAWVDQRLLSPMLLESEGKHQDARRELERLVEMQPQSALAWHCLGTVHFHQGTLNRAIDCYRKALDLAPRFLLCWYDLGVAYYHRGNMPASIAAYRHCLEIDAHYNAAHYRLGVALFHAGDLDQMRDCGVPSAIRPRVRGEILGCVERGAAGEADRLALAGVADERLGDLILAAHLQYAGFSLRTEFPHAAGEFAPEFRLELLQILFPTG
jgi:tetratricopeptide (TPR) repeat protein